MTIDFSKDNVRSANTLVNELLPEGSVNKIKNVDFQIKTDTFQPSHTILILLNYNLHIKMWKGVFAIALRCIIVSCFLTKHDLLYICPIGSTILPACSAYLLKFGVSPSSIKIQASKQNYEHSRRADNLSNIMKCKLSSVDILAYFSVR